MDFYTLHPREFRMTLFCQVSKRIGHIGKSACLTEVLKVRIRIHLAHKRLGNRLHSR